MLPSIISQLVVILKDSALAYAINYLELLRAGQNLATYRGNLIPTLIVLAVIYIVINYGLTRVARARGDTGCGPASAGSAQSGGGRSKAASPSTAGAGGGRPARAPERRRHRLTSGRAVGRRSPVDGESVGRRPGGQRAVSVARDSRTTVTLI